MLSTRQNAVGSPSIAGCFPRLLGIAAWLTRSSVCGNTVANGGMPATSGCNMLCAGNRTEYCGGPNRLNLYEFEAVRYVMTADPCLPAAMDLAGGSYTSDSAILPLACSMQHESHAMQR